MSRPILPNTGPESTAAYMQASPGNPQASPYTNTSHSSNQHSNQSAFLPGPSSANASDGFDDAAAGSSGIGASGGAASKTTYAKRGKITIVACVPCRKRKTKCDGKRPSCTQCASREGLCTYDMTDDQRKLTYLRDNVEQLQEKSSSLESLLHTVQSATEPEAAEIFRRVRRGGDLQTLAEQVQAGQLLSGVGNFGQNNAGFPRVHSDHSNGDANSLPLKDIGGPRGQSVRYESLFNALAEANPEQSNEILRRVKSGDDVQTILQSVGLFGIPMPDLVHSTSPTGLERAFAQQDQTFGVFMGAEMSATHASAAPESGFEEGQTVLPWTTVTQDTELIEHLLTLYFSWQHSFFQSFPEKLFRADMAAGRTKYCSSILVNAICAAGCFLSSRSEPWQDRGDGKTLMDGFLGEAERLLRQATESTITTVAALGLTSYVTGTLGRLSDLWMFSGTSSLMAQDINLHLGKTRKAPDDDEQELEFKSEAQARLYAFWGSYHFNQTTAFTLGRLPSLPYSGVTVDLPPNEPDIDDEPWEAYENYQKLPYKPGARASTFRHCAALSQLINSTLYMLFAPTVPLSGASLLAEYQKYLSWRKNLPSVLSSTVDAPPHILCLHMYYHAAILLLFRPFLKAKISNADFTPRYVCRSSAETISELWDQHHNLYRLSGIYMFQVHCLLTALTIHVIGIPSISATRHFVRACSYLNQLVDRNKWAKSCLSIIQGLVEKWDLVLPEDAEQALYSTRRDSHDPALAPPLQPLRTGVPPDDPPMAYVQPTNPATTYPLPLHVTQMVQATRRSSTDPSHFHMNSGNSAPNSSETSPSSPIATSNQTSQSTKRSSSHTQPQVPIAAGHKRPRLVAPTAQMLPMHSSQLRPLKPPVEQPSENQQNIQSNPASYLYTPLTNQPPPMLMPANAGVASGISMGAQDCQGAANTTALSPQQEQQLQQQLRDPKMSSQHATSQTPSTNLSEQVNATTAADATKIEKPEAGGTQSQSVNDGAVPAAVGGPAAVARRGTEGARGMANPQAGVEGLTFGNDWRDPFMGFFQGTEG